CCGGGLIATPGAGFAPGVWVTLTAPGTVCAAAAGGTPVGATFPAAVAGLFAPPPQATRRVASSK
ncbi:MAG TPA: hypothetical protein VIC60_06485, partial [Thermomicrobiales bacterium]